MGGLLTLLLSIQSTLGPCSFLNEQAVLPDSCLEVMGDTVYAPTLLASELVPPIGAAVDVIQIANREIFPSQRAAVLPSAYYLADDTQYFPQHPEFKMQTRAEIRQGAKTRASK